MAKYRRFASLGLVLSALAALTAFGAYVVQQQFSSLVQVSLGLVIAGVILFVLLDPERARRMVSGRQARYGSNALILGISFLGIVVVVNYLIYQNAQDWNLRTDLTEDQANTFAPETLETLDALPGTVQAVAFFTGNIPSDSARDLLDDYQFFSKGRFEYEFIDPVQDPLAANEAGITRDGSILLKMGENQELVTIASERELTAALIRLMNPNQAKIYFVTGHGERGLDDTGEAGLAQVRNALQQKNYQVESVNLLSSNQVPADASVVVVAGPRLPFTGEEVGFLSEYLSNGGSLIVMYEPVALTEFGESIEPLTAFLADSRGITLGNDLVVDLASTQPLIAIGDPTTYGSHIIVDELAGILTLFPTARSVQVDPESTATAIISSSAQSWAETDLASLSTQDAFADPDLELIGPIPLLVQEQDALTGGRLVVVGDADFASNATVREFGNRDLMVNMVDWAAQQEDILSLTPRNTTQRFLLPPQQLVRGLLLLGFVFVLPGLMLVAGVVVWIQRRRRG